MSAGKQPNMQNKVSNNSLIINLGVSEAALSGIFVFFLDFVTKSESSFQETSWDTIDPYSTVLTKCHLGFTLPFFYMCMYKKWVKTKLKQYLKSILKSAKITQPFQTDRVASLINVLLTV